MAEKEGRGVIYTIEFDAAGNLVRWQSRPAPERGSSALADEGRGRWWILFFMGIGLALVGISIRLWTSGIFWIYMLGVSLLLLFSALGLFLHTVQTGKAWISADEFRQDWLIDRRRQRGYKYQEHAGCYVIATYKEKPETLQDLQQYDHVYVGQSLHVYQRVYSHLCGRGNGEVYGDIKYGLHAYVQIIKCRAKEMNALEKELIARYHAMASYNRTSGGAWKWN